MQAVKPQKKAAPRSAKTARATKNVVHVKRVRKADGTVKTVLVKKGTAGIVGKAPAKKPLTAAEILKTAVLTSMTFGRGLATFDLIGIGVPKPVKGKKASDAVRAAGITTPKGDLTKRYR